MRRHVLPILLAALLAMAALLPIPALAAAGMDEETFVRMLQKALRDNPDLVLDVLRGHSESVLDIAQQGSMSRRRRSLEAQWRNDMKTPKKVRLEGRPTLGQSGAKVRIVGFTDFTCHYCQQASEMLNVVLKEYGRNVCFVFKSMTFEEKGVAGLAASYFLAVNLQSSEKAWNFYMSLFANRDRLIAEGEEFLRKTASSLEVDMKRLQKDVKGKKVAEMLAEDQQDAQQLGIEGTPFFLVNNLVVRGALPLDLFKLAVDTALKKQ
ncbi:MAG: thioredoxin domain-containing protein [Desulfovibrio sp.]|jgi:protein-disulfide isomerase|nr:thioredoxin domain-containing protein [Desulfovibrio sp.]